METKIMYECPYCYDKFDNRLEAIGCTENCCDAPEEIKVCVECEKEECDCKTELEIAAEHPEQKTLI